MRKKDRNLLDMKHGEVFPVVSLSRNQARGRTLEQLSDAAEAKAIETGLKYLQTKARDAKTNQVDDPDITYVADKVASVLILEKGTIFSVVVRQPET
jgi:hypothetical protein